MQPPSDNPFALFINGIISWVFFGLGTALEPASTLLVELNTWNDLIFRILQTTAFIISISAGILTLRKLLGYRPLKFTFKRKKKNDNQSHSK